MDAADEKCDASSNDTALAILVDSEGKQFCTHLSIGMGAIVTRSEKMKKIVERAHGVLTYRPASPTAEQAKMWTTIEKCVAQTTTGFIVLIRLEGRVMNTLTLLGDAAGLAARRHDGGVSLTSAWDRSTNEWASTL